MSNSIKNPIYIIGNPRSGTSLLRIMLHTHPLISIPPESHFFLWLEDKYSNWNMEMLDTYLVDLFNSTKFETWKIDKERLKELIISERPTNYAELNAIVYTLYAKNHKKTVKYWGDKNKLWKEKLYKITKYYPNAFFIHLVRDGRDVACSYKELGKRKMSSVYAPKLPQDIEKIANKWIENNSFIEDYLKDIKPENKIFIKYEELLNSPKEEISKVLQKLNLEYKDEIQNYFKGDKKDIEPADFFQWKEKLTQPPDLSNIGKYKKQLTNEEINLFNEIGFKTLTKYNYL